jgi:hypothetical protein
MPRAYSPRLSTAYLASRIRSRPGVASVRIIPPRRSVPTRPTLLRVTLDGPRPVHSDFTLADARAWLAADEKAY